GRGGGGAGAGGGERAHFAVADERQRGRHGRKHVGQPPSDQVGHPLAAAAIGDVGGLDAGEIVEQLGGQVIVAAAACRAVVELPGLLLRQPDKIGGGRHG